MKKTALLIFALLILLTSLCFSAPTKTTYLRIHIRANSNEDFDQTVKYAVKNSIVEFLTPALSECKDLSSALKMVKQNLNNITRLQLHILFHMIFSHTYNYHKLDTKLWKLAQNSLNQLITEKETAVKPDFDDEIKKSESYQAELYDLINKINSTVKELEQVVEINSSELLNKTNEKAAKNSLELQAFNEKNNQLTKAI